MNARFDGFFFIGSCLFTFLFLALYLFLATSGYSIKGESILITYGIYTVMFDHPHIFQTLSRTHYDTEEFKKRKYLHTIGLISFILFGFIVVISDYSNEFIVFAAIYGSWHIIRQHSGFLKAYKIVNKDFDPLDNKIDAMVFYLGMFSCFFSDYSEDNGPVYIYNDLFVQFPKIPPWVGEVLWVFFCFSLAVFVLRQLEHLKNKKKINFPKILFLSVALYTHYIVFFVTAGSFLIAEALETAFHNVQYQGWMIHYQKKRFSNLKKVALKWLAFSMLYGFVAGGIELLSLSKGGLFIWLSMPFTMLVIYHYFTDGLIWKFSEDPKLKGQLFNTK